MKRFFAIALLGLLLYTAFLVFRGEEDLWVKDDRGVWVAHGAPASKPEEITAQENLIRDALNMYDSAKMLDSDLSNGPCLGLATKGWVVDLVHNPRQSIDDLASNQCHDYTNGKASHFIEISLQGDVVRIK